MDENETELVRLLYTRIGMVMEDASIIAIGLGAPSSTFDPDKIAELRKSVSALSALMDAAKSIPK
ncbi:hypothetical protein [Qipengyuania sp.]|uniref:hypothetical protein n=1 Tax=Qipengyuania sp. TaxID=2004515 RepID=UPI003BA94C7E